ncbi:hypothetical protein [Ensifer sp. LCM 4579]|nr:hypothetical protein [Ensifer sp. LCM 4579]
MRRNSRSTNNKDDMVAMLSGRVRALATAHSFGR